MDNILRVTLVLANGSSVTVTCEDRTGALAETLNWAKIDSIHIAGTRVRRETTIDRLIKFN